MPDYGRLSCDSIDNCLNTFISDIFALKLLALRSPLRKKNCDGAGVTIKLVAFHFRRVIYAPFDKRQKKTGLIFTLSYVMVGGTLAAFFAILSSRQCVVIDIVKSYYALLSCVRCTWTKIIVARSLHYAISTNKINSVHSPACCTP